jgi:hypothetical protein
MSGGYMILVRTPRDSGGIGMAEIWFAHIPNQERAVQAVEARTGGSQTTKVSVVGTVRHAVLIDQLGVSEGNLKRFDGQPA